MLSTIDLTADSDDNYGNSDDEFKYAKPPTYDFVPLSQVPSDVSSAEEECLAHTKSVIKARIGLRQRRAQIQLNPPNATNNECKQHDDSKNKKKQKKGGHRRSKMGSKRERAEARKKPADKRARYHAVVRGWRKGIFPIKEDAEAQLKRYNGCMESFQTLVEAHNHLYVNASPMPDTPNPMSPGEYVHTHRGKTYIVDIPLGPEFVTASMPMHIDYVIGKAQNQAVLEMLQRIKSIQTSQVLDPSSCKDPNCEYSKGDLKTQRYVLLERLYQLNCAIAHQEHKRSHGRTITI